MRAQQQDFISQPGCVASPPMLGVEVPIKGNSGPGSWKSFARDNHCPLLSDVELALGTDKSGRLHPVLVQLLLYSEES